MKHKTLNPFKEESLPWSEYIPKNADKLILGTFPTKEDKRDFEFFYPNKNNKFWRVLARISNFTLTDFEKTEEGKLLAVKERKQILDRLNLAITDIGARVLRQKNSSLDSNLFPIEFADIFSIINERPAIKTIILTSSTNGNSVLSWFTVYCSINDITLKVDKKNKSFPITTEITVNNKKINVVIVYSTSGATFNITEDFLVNQYNTVIRYDNK
jgi:G:T/U-mismatch repair DNA glycosylase